MPVRLAVAALVLGLLAACGDGPALETRTFEVRYLDGGTAQEMIEPYVYTDRPKAPGRVNAARQTVTVRETRDNLERIARVLAEHDRPPANVRLVFQIIRANGAGAPDSAIAPIEAQLRQLFRFRGYRLVAQVAAVGAGGSRFQQRVDGPDRLSTYHVMGEIETIGVEGERGSVRLGVSLAVAALGPVLETRLSVAIGQTAVIGGQPGAGPGALILAVRPELVAP